jgi:hypothetical protein
MRVAYLTTNKVNQQLAQRMAAACGVTLCPQVTQEVPPDGPYEAVLYDWDALPAEGQRELLAELLAGPLPHAVALHGYNLEADLEEALRRHTIVVYRRLQPRLFRSLRLAVRAVRTANAPGRTPEDECTSGYVAAAGNAVDTKAALGKGGQQTATAAGRVPGSDTGVHPRGQRRGC